MDHILKFFEHGPASLEAPENADVASWSVERLTVNMKGSLSLLMLSPWLVSIAKSSSFLAIVQSKSNNSASKNDRDG